MGRFFAICLAYISKQVRQHRECEAKRRRWKKKVVKVEQATESSAARWRLRDVDDSRRARSFYFHSMGFDASSSDVKTPHFLQVFFFGAGHFFYFLSDGGVQQEVRKSWFGAVGNLTRYNNGRLKWSARGGQIRFKIGFSIDVIAVEVEIVLICLMDCMQRTCN